MIVSIFQTSYVFAEESVDDYYVTQEIEKLKGLGFVNEDFDSSSRISRGEFISYVTKLRNIETDSYKNKNYFTDVTADVKYAGEINAAYEYRIISGFTDGTFKPDEYITYSDAIATLVNMTGYGSLAKVKGDYPLGYFIVAKECDITAGTKFAEKTSLTGGEVAKLIYNAMFSPVMHFNSISNNSIEYRINRDVNVLSEYHDIYYINDIVNATSISALANYNTTDLATIIVGNTKLKTTANQYVEFLGYPVECFYKDNDEEKQVIYMTEDADSKKIELSAEDINSFSNLKYSYGNNKKVTIERLHTLIVNGVCKKTYSENDFVPKNGFVTILNTKGSGYDVVVIYTYESFLLQRAVAGNSTKITFTEARSLRSFDIDIENDEMCFQLSIDNKKHLIEKFSFKKEETIFDAVTLPTIKTKSVANVFADKYENINGFLIPAKDAKFVWIDISTKEDNGTISMKSDDSIFVGENEYKTALEAPIHKYIPGDSGMVVFDYEGKAFDLIKNPYIYDEPQYAYLIAAKPQGALDVTIKAKILTDDGKVNVYEFAKKIRFNGKTEKDTDTILEKLNHSATLLDSTFTISQPIKVMFNDEGQVNYIDTVVMSVGNDSSYLVDHISRDMERTKLAARSDSDYLLYKGGSTGVCFSPKLLFGVPETETFEDKDYRVYMSWTPNYSSKMIDIFDLSEHFVPELAISYESSTQDSKLYKPYVVVDQVVTALDEDLGEVRKLHCCTGFGDAVYYSEDDNMFDGLERGDLICLYGVDNEVTRWEMILSIKDAKSFDVNTEFTPTKKHDFYADIYELYDINGYSLVVQRGQETSGGMREFMRSTSYNTEPGIMDYGVISYVEGRKPQITSFAHDYAYDFFKPVTQYPNESSKLFIMESTSGVAKLIIIYNGI